MLWQSASGRASVGRNRRACLGALLVDINPARAAVPLAREPRGAAAASGPGRRRRKREKSLHQENLEDVVTTLRPTVREDQEADSQERVCTETRSRLSSTFRITGWRSRSQPSSTSVPASPVHPIVQVSRWRGGCVSPGRSSLPATSFHLHSRVTPSTVLLTAAGFGGPLWHATSADGTVPK